MAGGDQALLLSDEMPEDDPLLGAAQAEEVVQVNLLSVNVNMHIR